MSNVESGLSYVPNNLLVTKSKRDLMLKTKLQFVFSPTGADCESAHF